MWSGSFNKTKYLFNQHYVDFGHYEPHFYCSKCESSQGPGEMAPKQYLFCMYDFDVDSNLRVGAYFLMLSVKSVGWHFEEAYNTCKQTTAT